MPIVNGQFQSSPLWNQGGEIGFNMQDYVFGQHTKADMGDYSSAAINYLLGEQDKAFALDMWNLQNRYNTPSAQMNRFKEAGLNPNLIYSQQNAASGFSAPQYHQVQGTKGTSMNNFQKAMSVLDAMRDVATAAADINEAFSRNSLRYSQRIATNAQGSLNTARDVQLRYLLGMMGDDPDSSLYQSPFAEYYRSKTALTESQRDMNLSRIDQIGAMINMIPDQQARLRALTALDEYRLKIISGQNDAILNINTGNDIWDSILKLLIYTGKDNLGGLLHLL